ncbi:MAG TPA: hypothetical protein PLS50_08365, partial [Candidatus Dojkabacteria bacterium]|nr:hypothetical protein [Candidatus Dojkabacteria bacterium]
MSKYSKKQKSRKLIIMLLSGFITVLIFLILLDKKFIVQNTLLFYLLGFCGLFILMDKIIDMFFSSWDSYDSYERGDQGEIVVANKLLEVEHSYSYQNIMLPNSKMDIDH